METYTVTAEHTQGKSVSHPCSRGIYDDPSDGFEFECEAETPEQAEELAYAELSRLVEDSQPCHCKRHLQAGSESWWNSVTVIIV